MAACIIFMYNFPMQLVAPPDYRRMNEELAEVKIGEVI